MFYAKIRLVKLPYGQRVVSVNGKPVPHLKNLRIPPAWVRVTVDPDPKATCVATGYDAAGRLQRLYSPDHVARAKSNKFERVRGLLREWEDIRTQIELDINDKTVTGKDREAALVAYLIYETGIRPGSNTDTLAKTKAYGATTIQLRHVKICQRGVRLQFVGKKGVSQNVLVTNPYLVKEIAKRKSSTTSWSTRLFDASSSKVNQYIGTLGSGCYTAKDFRTACGTSLAIELLGSRKRLPASKKGRKELLNDTLDRVAKKLGNTRAVARGSYVDPVVLDKILSVR